MPNWCQNHIKIRGSDANEIQRLADAFKEGKFLNAIVPVPEDLYREGSSSFGGDNSDLYEQIRKENQQRHGYDSWYEFCLNHWGTKWDVGDEHMLTMDDDGLGFSASFDSAWAPPVAAMEQLVEDGFSVTLDYNEPGMCFVGRYEDGDDQHYDYGELDSEEVRNYIGEELDDFWSISESMAEWEEEERREEELYRFVKDGEQKLNLVSE